MSMQDNISDFLNQLKLAQNSNKIYFIIYYSKIKFKILSIIFQFGYINNFYCIILKKKKFIKIFLKYRKKNKVITQIKRISKPSLRVYKKYHEFKKINYGLGILIISTSYGIMSHYEAFEKKIGGEIICYIY